MRKTASTRRWGRVGSREMVVEGSRVSAASVGVAKFVVEVVDDEEMEDPSRHCLRRCTMKAWTSESMFPWIRAVSQSYVL